MTTLVVGTENLVLVLDTSFRPVRTVHWHDAMTLWATDKVEILEVYDRVIRAVEDSIMFMPAVIRFLKMGKKKKRAVRFSRDAVYARDNGCCQYCGSKVSRTEFTYDHVTPRKQGGQTTWENIVIACIGCNQRKGGRTPQQAQMYPLRTPVKPSRPHDPLVIPVIWLSGMPDAWRNYLASDEYWHGDLT